MKFNKKSAQDIFKTIFQNFFKLVHGNIEGVIKLNENKEIEIFPIKKNENKLYNVFKVKNGILYTDRINDTAIIYKKKIIDGPSFQFRDLKSKVINGPVETNIVLKKGTYTYLKPNKVDKKNIIIGKRVINNLNKKGVAQGVIVVANKIISTENEKGTDSMINKSKFKILRLKLKNKVRMGILIKLPKPNQDLRTDLPTIGFKTVSNCIKAGLKGIVIKGKYNIFLDQNKCIKLANKNKFFIHAI